MTSIVSLIAISIVMALLCLILKGKVRGTIVCIGTVALIAISVILAITFFVSNSQITSIDISISSHVIDYIIFAIGIFLSIVVCLLSIKHKKKMPFMLGIAQLLLEIYLEFFSDKNAITVDCSLTIDILGITMMLIVSIIGGIICIYAIGYMDFYQKSKGENAKDSTGFFFFLCTIFLGAMFLIIFSDNMVWMLCGWEVTTVCSFLLIRFTKSDEAIRNSFLQITYNMIGGICFSVAIIYCARYVGTIQFSDFLQAGSSSANLVAFPLVLFVIAGLTKAAQLPFCSWLLGAMVAPTPTSALLHSSTMVKAGVFLIIKVSPLFTSCKTIGLCVVFIGSITFLLTAFLAIMQTNAKRVLAYSTISNLGLIVMCAGVATQTSIWAALMLVIFHAVAKSLLFMCVGTAEHHIGSRDIESFDYIFDIMPTVSRFMMLGIIAMFVAPFGMLIAKWGALISLIDSNLAFVLIVLAFGSALTFVYWAKWLGKISGTREDACSIESSVSKSEKLSLSLVAAILACISAALPLVSSLFGDSAANYLFGSADAPKLVSIPDTMLIFCGILTLAIIIFLFLLVGEKRPAEERKLSPYLSGITHDVHSRKFVNSFGDGVLSTSRNMYFSNFRLSNLYLTFQLFASCALLFMIFSSAIGFAI